MEDIVKIPKERIAVLIGRKGEIKRELEEKTNKIVIKTHDDILALFKRKDEVAVHRDESGNVLYCDYVPERELAKNSCNTDLEGRTGPVAA